MKRKIPSFITALCLLVVLTSLFAVKADAADAVIPKRISSIALATADNRPLSIDRLMYTAFKDIDYQAAIMSSSSLQLSYELTNIGERAGVISSTPNMQALYPNLRRVPVVIENNNINTFTMSSGAVFNSWDDLSLQRVGILTQRVHISGSIPVGALVTTKETPALLMAGLVAGEYDVIVMSQRGHETLSLPDGVTYSGTVETLPEYLYLHTNYEFLISDITKSLETLMADGRAKSILSDEPMSDPGAKKTVLHILSFNTELVREDLFAAQMREHFLDDDSIEWYTFALNSRRFYADANRNTTIARLLRQDCASRNVAAIVVSGESAIKFIEEYYQLFFRNIPVIFYGMDNEFFEDVGSFKERCTGILESVSANETAEMALELFPNTSNIFVINDYTAEGTDYRESAMAQLAPLEGRLNIEYNGNTSRDELLAQVRALPEDSVVIIGSYFCDANEQYYSQNEMRRAMELNCSVPIFTIYSIDSGYGAIGGKCPDYELYGGVVASQLRELLGGVPVTDIPIITDSSNYSRWVFDKNDMDKWSVGLNALPAGAKIFNRTPSVWESDPMLAYALVAIIALCVIISVGLTIFLNAYNKQKTHLRSAQELLSRDNKLREVKERLERIINTAPLAFVQTVDGMAVETNEYIEKNIGITSGKKMLPFYSNPFKRTGLIARAMAQTFVENDIVEFNMPDGGKHRFLTNVSVVDYEGHNSFILWAMDIEELERKKDDLHLAHENLQLLLDKLPTPILIFTIDDGLVAYANNAAFALIGAETDIAVDGVPVLRFLPSHQPDGTTSVEKLKNFISEKTYSAELTLKKISGEELDCLVTTCLLEYNGRLSSLGMIQDLTAEKEYARMLRDTAEKEKEANMLKSRFLVNMSHEIRTPMNAIIGLTEIELRKNPSRETRDIYIKINSSAKNLLNIINDILDLSKIEADKIELFDNEFELEEVIGSALLVATPRLDEKDVEFMLNVSLELPRYLIGDRTRLWQILKNFLDNAAKFTEAGKIVLTVTENKTRSTAETVCISFIIEDTGIGMNEEQLNKLFIPYVQIYNDAQKRYTGSGLGMAISKRLSQIMGGELRVESTPGVGTIVYITLPFKRTRESETEMQAVVTPTLDGARVLAVDDDEVSLMIMKSLFEASGAECDVAVGGEEALDMVFRRRDMGGAYDLILLDYMLGGISGLETAKRIRSGLSSAPRLLMVTAYQRLLLREDLQTNGINDIIEKPFIPSLFIKKVCEVISGRETGDMVIEALPQFTGVRVLLCEDYYLNQEVAIGIFEQFGIETVVAENGKEGLDKLAAGEAFDIIFMDLQMPVMDGYAAAKAIRSDTRYDNIPIISLTADAMREVVDRCIEHGMNDHIAKPIDINHVRNIFLKWLPDEKRVKDSAPKPVLQYDAVEEAVRRFGGNRERYERALSDFTHDLPDTWEDFDSAVQNSEHLRREVHKIKGAAGNLSETALFQSADLLENALRVGKPERGYYERFVGACAALKTRISSSDASKTTDSSGAEWTEAELSGCLDKLENALSKYDPRGTSEAVQELRSKPLPERAAMLSEVFVLAANYEFEAALKLLQSSR